MFGADVCDLPVTGGRAGLVVAAAAFVVIGLVMTRWLRSSVNRLSVMTFVPIVILGASAFAANSDACNSEPSTTTTTTTTTTITTTTTTIPLTGPEKLALCVSAVETWLPQQTDYQQVSDTRDAYEVVDFYEERAQAELSMCAGLDLVENEKPTPKTSPASG